MQNFTVNLLTNKLNSNQPFISQGVVPEQKEYRYNFSYDPSVTSAPSTLPCKNQKNIPYIHLHFEIPALDITGIWCPDNGFRKALSGDLWAEYQVNLSHSAPVVCFFNSSDHNCLTFALSEVNRDTILIPGVHEETGEIYVDIIIYLSESPESYQLSCLFDFRDIPFYSVLRDISSWWDSILPSEPMPIPADAKLPMYSTWYSYHQEVDDESLSREYALASRLGMRTVIIDDGWQTSDNNRGYAYCGDWDSEISKFPQFSDHVQKLHNAGMKCLLWYSVPFVGIYSSAWPAFKNMLLHYNDVLHAGILDPRYPEVRDYLQHIYTEALKKWDLDGFKLDFIDSFHAYDGTPSYQEQMDFTEIQDAVYDLMLNISKSLREIKPGIMIEFRQNYIGPQMRRFGNIFRVGDCPMSAVNNRVGITDLKLLSGSTAVHSDMIMWNRDETPENIAIQILNCIFSTLQISVKLNTLKEKQRKVLEYYLLFSIRYSDILQNGTFSPRSPLSLYPVLQAHNPSTCIAVCYLQNTVVTLAGYENWDEIWLFNATSGNKLYFSHQQSGHYHASVYDCCGIAEKECPIQLLDELHTFSISPGGSVCIKRCH